MGTLIPNTTGRYLTASSSLYTAPSKLFYFNGTKNELIDGNHLTLAAGTEKYIQSSVNNKKAGYFDNSTYYTYSGTDISEYRNLAEMSAVARIRYNTRGAEQMIYSIGGGSSENEADNFLHRLAITTANELQYFHESGAGSNSLLTSSINLMEGQDYVVGFTRASNGTDVTIYVQGQASLSSTSFTAPSGGGNSRLAIGADDDGGTKLQYGSIGCLAFLFGNSWSAAEHLAIAKELMPTLN